MPDTIAECAAFTVETEDGIATLRFRKAFLDVAVDLHTRGELLRVIERLEHEPGLLGLVSINDEDFSGGDQISALMKNLAEKGSGGLPILQRFKHSFFQIVSRNISFRRPLVSGIIGEMTLDEFGMALISDRVLLSEDCIVRNVSTAVGLPAAPILTFLLTRIVGAKRAITLLTNDEPLRAAEALELGLADSVVARADLEDACRTAVLRLSSLPSPVVSATRGLIFAEYDKLEEHVDRYLLTAMQILHARDHR